MAGINITNKKIHMIGIGGIGMSGLSFLLAGMGNIITGSDLEENNIIEKLRKIGVDITIGHRASSVKDQDLVTYSSSIRMDNPEVLAAKEKKIPVISRTELLKIVLEKYKKVIAVTGTHGKTTITAMSALLLEESNYDPTVLIGGESPHFNNGNAKLGKKNIIVAEMDESDGRFQILRATHILVPNLEKEHVEHYKDEAHLINTFMRFLNAQSKKTVFFHRIEDPNLGKLAKIYKASKGKTVSFGFWKKADVYADSVKTDAFQTQFDCFYKRRRIGRFLMHIPGVHNVLNALCVISLGIELGISIEKIKRTLSTYRGVKRRFEVVGEFNGAKIVEDYAHHPTEIKVTIQAAHSLKPKRLITVFQPHRYTRTRSFYKEFSTAFSGSDSVILTGVYSASEKRIKNASSKRIYDLMIKNKEVPVKFMAKDAVLRYLSKNTRKGDIVLVLGAGDIGKTAHELSKFS